MAEDEIDVLHGKDDKSLCVKMTTAPMSVKQLCSNDDEVYIFPFSVPFLMLSSPVLHPRLYLSHINSVSAS